MPARLTSRSCIIAESCVEVERKKTQTPSFRRGILLSWHYNPPQNLSPTLDCSVESSSQGAARKTSPALKLLQMYPQPSLRLRSNTTLDLGFTFRVRTALLKLDLEATNPRGQQARELCLREFLANATPRSMQESKETVVAVRTAAVVGRAIGIEPTLGLELESVWAPERC